MVLAVIAAGCLLATSSYRVWEKVSEVRVSSAITSFSASLVRALIAAILASTRALLATPGRPDGVQKHLEGAFWVAVGAGVGWELAAAIAKARKEKLVATSRYYASIIAHFVEAENRKRQRVETARASIDEKVGLPAIKKALDPGGQIAWLLDSIAVYYARRAGLEDMEAQEVEKNFRVALFEVRDGSLAVTYSFSLRGRQRSCLEDLSEYQERFRLDNKSNPSCAVKCIQDGKLVIVEDGKKVRDFYLHPRQSNHLLSLVAYPIMTFRGGAATYGGAIVVDTEIAKFFRESDRKKIEFFFRQVEARINLEDNLSRFLDAIQPRKPSRGKNRQQDDQTLGTEAPAAPDILGRTGEAPPPGAAPAPESPPSE